MAGHLIAFPAAVALAGVIALVPYPAAVGRVPEAYRPTDAARFTRIAPDPTDLSVAPAALLPAAPAAFTAVGTESGPAREVPFGGAAPSARFVAKPGAGPLSTNGFVGQIVIIWKTSQVSWYGPGMYGSGTACGLTLSMTLVGVAHRTLPCGTMVQFRWNGVTVTAPVVDRGPYVTGRDWDLTYGLCALLNHCWTGPLTWRIP